VKCPTMTRSQVPCGTHSKVQLCRVAESWDLRAAPDFQHKKGVEGHARSPGIRLGRGTTLSSLNLHPKPTTKGLFVFRNTLGCWDKPRHFDTQDSPWPGLGGSHHLPHIVFSAAPRGSYI